MLRQVLCCCLLISAVWSYAQQGPRMLSWTFPLPRPHTGILLGNGVQGLMVWGDSTLNVTIGRAGFWDRRGGNAFSTRTTFAEVRALLEARDEPGLRAAFAVPKRADNQPPHPQQLGGGRLELRFPPGWRLVQGDLLLDRADIRIQVRDPRGKLHLLTLAQAPDQELAWISLPKALQGRCTLRLIPAWESPAVQQTLIKWGVSPPETGQEGPEGYAIQRLPEDAPLTLAWRQTADRIWLGSALGAGQLEPLRSRLRTADAGALTQRKDAWWAQYWSDVPAIRLPDPVLQEIVDYGLYKQACSTPPQGLPCALQGPFMEDYQLPPWSNDYHFNINIQMIYTPALASNRLAHLDPVWKMLAGWMPQLRRNGEAFFGQPGALMLPHAVDDSCQVVGTFWTGTIDHACTAWMAYLAWQHYRYGMDRRVLEQTAWPLLVGAFEGYWAMLEEVSDDQGNTRLSLPVSVSPEYRGDAMNAWGRDASFQLAALHKIAAVLPQAAAVLGKPADPRWAEVSRRLPPYTTVDGPWIDESPWGTGQRIGLWEGMDLVGSHRHHSHLGGMYPFITYDPADPAHAGIVRNSINRWVHEGMGMWSGWCVPWAAVLQSRIGHTEAAVSYLHHWQRNFVNEGRGTLHNSNAPGGSIFYHPVWSKLPPGAENREIMQLDAGFGALSAVLELLVQQRPSGIHVLPDLHMAWKDLEFDGIRTEGAFLIGAAVQEGQVQEIRVRSEAGGLLRLHHGLGAAWTLDGAARNGSSLELDCRPGQELVLRRME